MNIDALKLSLLTYIKHFGLYDYLAFCWLIVTFLIVIVLAILVAKRSSVFSLLIIILALFFLGIAPFFIKYKLADVLRATSTEVTLIKKLNFSDSLIVEGTISNNANKDFSLCLVQTFIVKQSDAQGIKALLTTLKPIANQSIFIKQSITKESSIEFQSVFDNFHYTGDVNATVKAECY